MYGHTPGLCLLACSLEVKAQGKLLHNICFFMRGKHLESLQDDSVAVTGACTVRASDGASLPGSCYRALSVICRNLGLTGHFLHTLCIPPPFSNRPLPTKALFSRRIKAQIVVSVPRAESAALTL